MVSLSLLLKTVGSRPKVMFEPFAELLSQSCRRTLRFVCWPVSVSVALLAL